MQSEKQRSARGLGLRAQQDKTAHRLSCMTLRFMLYWLERINTLPRDRKAGLAQSELTRSGFRCRSSCATISV